MTWKNGDCLQNGKYLILEELGEGGFGITYKAKHTHLNQFVVIKTPNDSLKNDPNYPRFVERFIEEGRKLASLSEKKHPHIVRATDLFFEGTLPCLAMDFVDGENLVKIVEKKPLSETKALEYIRQIGEALCVVHGEGMVHRDAHPANIIVKSDGNAVLIDFGLAADVAAAIPSSQHPANRAFASYEQEIGNGLPTVDVYTLAATLYFIITRRPPTTAVDRKFNKLALPEPKSFNSNISKELNSAILRGMELEAKNRPQSMHAWLDLLPSSRLIPKSTSNPQKGFRFGFIVTILVIAGGGFYLYYNPKVLSIAASLTNKNPTINNQLPRDLIILMTTGLEKSLAQDYKGALSDYDKAIQIQPDYPDAYFWRGSAKMSLGDDQSALFDYSKAIQLKPDYTDAYRERGLVNHNLKDYKSAILDYDKAIQLKPDEPRAYIGRGLVKGDTGDFQGALSDYNESIRLQPASVTYFLRGQVKSALKDSQGAISDYNEAIRLQPNYARAYYNRGNEKSYLKDNQGAIADYTQAIRLQPNYDEAYNNRGNEKKVIGDNQGAIADYNEAIRIKPNKSEAYTNRGNTKAVIGDKQGAISDYNEAIRIEPSNADAYFNRGLIKWELGDRQGCLIDLQTTADIFKYQGRIEEYNTTIKAIESFQVFKKLRDNREK